MIGKSTAGEKKVFSSSVREFVDGFFLRGDLSLSYFFCLSGLAVFFLLPFRSKERIT